MRETIRAAGGTVTGVLTPIDARRSIAEQCLRDQRMRAVRGLALRSAASLTEAATALVDRNQTILAAGAPSVERIFEVTRKLADGLAAWANPRGQARSIVNLTRLLKRCLDRLKSIAGVRVSLDVSAEQPDFTFAPVFAFADEGQLEEVMVALTASICRDALVGSTLTIACDLHTVTERIPDATLAPGTYARLVFHHRGRGLEFELQEPLFESLPAFEFLPATPSPKRATLPALSRAYGTVREWGGDIAFLSKPDAAVFSVYLPHSASVDWERDLILSGESAPAAGGSYRDLVDQDLVDLFLAEIARPDTARREVPDVEPFEIGKPFEIDAKMFE